jgi:hypothetical protein
VAEGLLLEESGGFNGTAAIGKEEVEPASTDTEGTLFVPVPPKRSKDMRTATTDNTDNTDTITRLTEERIVGGFLGFLGKSFYLLSLSV